MQATKIMPAHKNAFYQQIAQLETGWKLIETKLVPPCGGGATRMARGRVARIKLTEGPQVVDFNCWSQADNREHFWSGRTRILEGAHLTAGNRLWSTHPWMRPMITIVNDTVRHAPSPGGEGACRTVSLRLVIIGRVQGCGGHCRESR